MWLSLSPVFPSSGPAMEQLFLLSQTTQTIDVSIITALKLPLTANGHTFVHQQQCKKGGAVLHSPGFMSYPPELLQNELLCNTCTWCMVYRYDRKTDPESVAKA